MSEQHRPDDHVGERPSSAMSQDLRVRLTGGVEDYPRHADGPVQYVVVAYMAGILLAVYASDAEGALGYVVRPELGPDASNSTGFWLRHMRSAWVRRTPPTQALAEMVALAQRDGLPYQAWVVPGPWRVAPSLAALEEEIVGDGEWDRRPRDLKLNVYPVIPFRGPKMLAPEVTDVMRYVARRQPGKVIFAVDPAYDPHGEVPEERMLGGWSIDENGEIGEFHFNPSYEPTLTALRYLPPENEVERTLQALCARRGSPEALLHALREGTLLVSVDEDGRQLRFRQGDDGERYLDVYTGTRYTPDDGRQVRPMSGRELAKGLFGCNVEINPGSRASIWIPSSDLAVSAFG